MPELGGAALPHWGTMAEGDFDMRRGGGGELKQFDTDAQPAPSPLGAADCSQLSPHHAPTVAAGGGFPIAKPLGVMLMIFGFLSVICHKTRQVDHLQPLLKVTRHGLGLSGQDTLMRVCCLALRLLSGPDRSGSLLGACFRILSIGQEPGIHPRVHSKCQDGRAVSAKLALSCCVCDHVDIA